MKAAKVLGLLLSGIVHWIVGDQSHFAGASTAG
jgi:hypothetical protein